MDWLLDSEPCNSLTGAWRSRACTRRGGSEGARTCSCARSISHLLALRRIARHRVLPLGWVLPPDRYLARLVPLKTAGSLAIELVRECAAGAVKDASAALRASAAFFKLTGKVSFGARGLQLNC